MTKLPKTFQAGTSLIIELNHPLIESGWSLTYCLRGSGVIDFEVADGGVNVPASITKAWTSGEYQWRLFAKKDDQVIIADEGYIKIEPDFEAMTGVVDVRSHARRMLDSINKILEGRILSDHEKYSIDGRSLDRIPITELHRLRKKYILKCQQEEHGTSFRLKRVISKFRT